MEKGKVCCCCSGKKTVEKLQHILQKMGCHISNQDDKKCEQQNKRGSVTKQPFADPYELNIGGKKNPCIGVLGSPKSYVDPPNLMPKTVEHVTLDGRRACQYEPPPKPLLEWSQYGGARNPPWVRPRYASVELRGGVHHLQCACGRRDGLRDDCPRWDCAGRPECLLNPWPDCCPHTTACDYGIRPRNKLPPPDGAC